MKKLALAGVMAAMGLMTTASMAVIQGSKHDLSANSGNTIRAETVNEICAFCHTPHGSNTAFIGAPLWNKAIDTTITYQVYGGGQTTAGTQVDQPGDVSRACLSCHDGVNAINSIINVPGSGQWYPNGDYYVSMTMDGGATYSGNSPVTMAQNTANPIMNIGTDLRNDHPVGVVYTANSTNPADNPASLRPVTDPFDGTKTIADVLRNGKVECVSCHDPHKGENMAFLRKPNDGSALCLTCHAK